MPRLRYRRPVSADAESAPKPQAPLAGRRAHRRARRAARLRVAGHLHYEHAGLQPFDVRRSGDRRSRSLDAWRALAARAPVRRQVQPALRPPVRHRLPSCSSTRLEARAARRAAPDRRRSMRAGSPSLLRRPRPCDAALVRRRAARLCAARLRAARRCAARRDRRLLVADRRSACSFRPLSEGFRSLMVSLAAEAVAAFEYQEFEVSNDRRLRPAARSSTRCARRRGSSPGAGARRSASSATPRSSCRWRPASCSASSSAGARWLERAAGAAPSRARGAARAPRRGARLRRLSAGRRRSAARRGRRCFVAGAGADDRPRGARGLLRAQRRCASLDRPRAARAGCARSRCAGRMPLSNYLLQTAARHLHLLRLGPRLLEPAGAAGRRWRWRSSSSSLVQLPLSAWLARALSLRAARIPLAPLHLRRSAPR